MLVERRQARAGTPACTSSTTRYWFDCVKIVDTSRWPNALYSALSIAAGVMPSRLAVVRSNSTYACSPPSWKSLATSASCGRVLQAVGEPAHPGAQLLRVDGLDGELVLRAADAVLDRQVLHRLHVQRDAVDVARASAAAAG